MHCPWLVESHAPDSSWGLGCKICASADNAPRNSLTLFTKGQNNDKVLQLEDLKRHAESDFHMARCENSNSMGRPGAVTAGQDGQAVPTAAQIRLALEVARCPLGAQGCEYARRAELASRSDSGNFPHQFNDRLMHMKVLECLSKVLSGSPELRRTHLAAAGLIIIN